MAPEPVNVAVCPAQIVTNGTEIETVGTGVTIKLTVFDDEQPKALAAVTV